MERKILITSIFITLGAIAFLSGYLLMPEFELNRQTGTFLERFDNKVEVGPGEEKTPNTVPLSSRKFLSFVNPFTDSQKIVAVDKSGNIIEIDLANLAEKVVYSGLTTITETVLSPAGDSVIYSFYDNRNDKKHAYLNFRKGESTPIAGELKSAAFSPRGDQAAYLVSRRSSSGTDGGGELLISKGGNIVKRALKTRLGAAVVSWPSDFLSIVSYDKNGYGDLFVLKENSELNKILSYQYNLSVKWSPLGEKIVFSVKDETNLEQLFYKEVENDKPPVPLGVSTGSSKCVWAGEEEVMCGVKNQAKVRDEFYRVNLTNGTRTLVATPSINLLTKEIALSRSGDTLFVLNDIDNKLYVLKLK